MSENTSYILIWKIDKQFHHHYGNLLFKIPKNFMNDETKLWVNKILRKTIKSLCCLSQTKYINLSIYIIQVYKATQTRINEKSQVRGHAV